MGFVWNYFFILSWIAYLICSGILLFSRGFLLSRIAQKDITTCRHLSEDITEEYYLNYDIVQEIFKDVNASSNLCLPKKSKVIILVIDSLKYEFGIYKPNISNPLPFENKLNVIEELLRKDPERSRLMKFQADPPTTTLQRLKGLTTGSLPTFIDIGSNFATAEINEDNIIDQIVRSDLNAVFLGDSTWTDLYPRRFLREYSYPSFDIFDLDTVDVEIQKHLPNELMKTDWDVLIAHFLGVDHCGHKFGPLHNEMSRKLSEMDDMIRSVLKSMDLETILLVVGDHGMTMSGDHGGASEDELNALLFAYSPKYAFISSDYSSDNETMKQIDIVPTLATILGVPVPYSNLGFVNFNIVPDVPVSHMLNYQGILIHAWQNANQIYNYFYNYALNNKRSFDFDQIEDIEHKFIELSHRVNAIYNEAGCKSFLNDLQKHLRITLEICQNIWVNFDANQMSQGLLLTFLPIFFSFLLINNSCVSEYPTIFNTNMVWTIYLLNIIVGTFSYQFYKDLNMKSEEHSVTFMTGMLSTVILVLATIQNWSEIANNWNYVKRFKNIITRLIFVISISVFFSNSLVVQEQKVVSYLLTGLLILLLYQNASIISKFDIKTKFKLSTFAKSLTVKIGLAIVSAIFLVRFSYVLFRCREEQGDCLDFSHSINTLKNDIKSQLYLITVITLGLYVSLIRIYLRSCGNLTGFQLNVILARYGPTVGAICACGHMLLSNSSMKNIRLAHVDALAWVVYALFILQLLVLLISPLMTYVLPKKPKQLSINPYGKMIPEIFKKMKEMYEGGQREDGSDVPIVYGLATAYSASLTSFGVFLTLLLAILLHPRAALGIFTCSVIGIVILVSHSILRFRTAKNLEQCMQPTFTAVVAWFLLSHFGFFATSHQTTMSQIDWRAAFVGRSTNYDHSIFLSGFLVILNTFCGQILFFVLYPLLTSQIFSMYALYPSLSRQTIKKKSDLDVRTTLINKNEMNNLSDFDITRGELLLYEHNGIFFGTLFKLAVQMFMLQGIKIFCAMMACTIHCRHLMVWKIFAPRFIYECLATFVSFPALIFGYLIIVRVHWALVKLINQIDKLK